MFAAVKVTPRPPNINYKITCSSRQQEDEGFGRRFLELINHIPTIGNITGPIQPEESILPHVHKIFENINHLGHLTENKHLTIILLLLLKNLIQLPKFGGVSNQVAKINNRDLGQGRILTHKSLKTPIKPVLISNILHKLLPILPVKYKLVKLVIIL